MITDGRLRVMAGAVASPPRVAAVATVAGVAGSETPKVMPKPAVIAMTGTGRDLRVAVDPRVAVRPAVAGARPRQGVMAGRIGAAAAATAAIASPGTKLNT
ncbi:MAG: hypothetical protein M3N08_06000 [Pseudomonadota bacterium]|nr:hypothetical protein [Pseudomonadota bacterium]